MSVQAFAGVALEDTGLGVGYLTLASIAAHIVATLTRSRWPVGEVVEDMGLLGANGMYGTGAVLLGQWEHAGISAVVVAVVGWHIWRRHRRERKRVAGLLGAKSRALRDVLVRRVREVAKPGPVLRPVPGGAQ